MDQNRKLARDVLDELVVRARNMYWFTNSGGRTSPRGKPGEMIENLGPAKKFILSKLKAEDTEDIRWPR